MARRLTKSLGFRIRREGALEVADGREDGENQHPVSSLVYEQTATSLSSSIARPKTSSA